MLKACARCGKIHDASFNCRPRKKKYAGGEERKLRSRTSWTNKSIEIREKANYLCEVCKDQGILQYNNLSVHHITKLSEDESLLLENDNLICLCEKHHTWADAGELDPEYLRKLALQRETGSKKISPTFFTSGV